MTPRPAIFAALLACVTGCGDDGGAGDGTASGSASATDSDATTTSGSSTASSAAPGPESSGTTDISTSTSTTEAETTSGGGLSETDSSSGLTEGSTSGTSGEESTATSESSSTGEQVVSDDPFDPVSCEGTAWTGAAALAHLGGMPRDVLADATIQRRTRTCPGGICGEWSAAEDWIIAYLTWSGGVVTAYKDFPADMQLVLFDDAGTPRLSIQHVTFDAAGYDDEDGMVYDFPPAPIQYAHVRAWDATPDSRYYYQDLDYMVRDATLVLGDDCARFEANPYGVPEPYAEQFAALFRW